MAECIQARAAGATVQEPGAVAESGGRVRAVHGEERDSVFGNRERYSGESGGVDRATWARAGVVVSYYLQCGW